MTFRAPSHWASLCGRYEIRPGDWQPWWEKHGKDTELRPLNFFSERLPLVRWCTECDKRAADLVRQLVELLSAARLMGVGSDAAVERFEDHRGTG